MKESWAEAGIMCIMPSSVSPSTVDRRSTTLTLVCPGLAARVMQSGSSLPALSRLLAQARDKLSRTNSQNDFCDWQIELLSALRLGDYSKYASAPLTWLGCAPTDAVTSKHCSLTWLHVDPVVLSMSADGMALRALTDNGTWPTGVLSEVSSLVNKELAASGWQWHHSSDRAFIARELPLAAEMTSLRIAMSVSLRDALPKGEGAAVLRRLMTELQMIVHEKLRSAPEMNSVWLWGIGSMPPTTLALIEKAPNLWSNHPYSTGLYRSQSLDARCRSLPTMFGLLESELSNENVIVLEGVESELEENWFAPLAQAIERKRIARLQLCMDGWSGTIEPSRWRRWTSRSKSITEHLS